MSIPKKQLSHVVVRVKRGLSSYYLQNEGSEVSFINIRDVSEGRVHPETVMRVKVKETRALEKSRIEPGDLIITVKGSVFRAAVASADVKGYVISANLIAFTLNGEILPETVAAYLNSPQGQNELQARAVGVAQKALNMKSLLEITIPIPSISQQRVLAEYLFLAEKYDLLIRREQELRKKINQHIVQNHMLG